MSSRAECVFSPAAGAAGCRHFSTRYTTTPYLARPYVNVFNPKDTTQPAWMSDQQKEYSKVLFGKPIAAHPVLVAQTIHNLPDTGIPQVAVVGKSNVGKSSLINALMHGKEIARTSGTPGRTRHLFTFDLSDHLSLVDLPGYGFAKVPKEIKNDWAVLMEEYFTRAKRLERVVCLIESTRGPEELDERLWDMLQEKGRRLMLVLTKVDLLKPMDLHSLMMRVVVALQQLPPELVWPFVHAVSAREHLGVAELRCSLSAIASDHRRAAGRQLVKKGETPARTHR
ncbi:unnamed protein product [Vitrella brassicaformis CCMP3155]|uniref:EngB-type G domain-containing protein n=2 Tax=Vitrella brassicaformis TaxID=1169539 RepID=A0A0G4H6Q8_VITBC|nr:unnamed protein product [Vitrella brassicaformis CCMP3155]|eukprot:CEM39523.1 unnamed protein product [Vitrella brassicaformis CCMP3155]